MITVNIYHLHSVIATVRTEGNDRIQALKLAHSEMAAKGFNPNEYHLEVGEDQP